MAKCSKCGKSGLFLKLTEGLCNDCNLNQYYDALSFSYQHYESAPRNHKRYILGQAVLNILEKCPKELDDVILCKSERKSLYAYHKVFGCFFKFLPLEEIADKINRDLMELTHILNRTEKFSKEIATIPLYKIQLDPNYILSRLTLSDMPEIKYSPVGRTFSFDKIPSFVVIDTETTGLKVSGGRIIELSAILVEDLSPISAFSTLVNPQKPIPEDATSINGITDEMVANAPTLAQIAPDFLKFISNNPIVGYNLPFDLKFLWARGIDFTLQKRKYYDVLDICRKAFRKDLDTFTLENVSEFCGVYRSDSHRSLSDCLATKKVFEAAVDRLSD